MVTTAALTCVNCKGGGEINGVPCACQRAPRPPRGRRLLRGWSLKAAGWAGTLVFWSRSVPGVAGAAGVTLGLAMIVHAAWHWIPAVYVAALVGGVFGLLADRNL